MSYYDEYEDIYDNAKTEAEEEILKDTREVNTKDGFININFKEDMLKNIFKDMLRECCKDIVKEIKIEAKQEIKNSLIEEKFNEILEEELHNSVKEQTNTILNNFMDREITVSSGGYYGNTKNIKCSDLIEKDIEDFMKKDLKTNFENTIDNIFERRTKEKIEDYAISLRNEVGRKIDDMFNQTTKNVLSEQLFYILSQNETYQKLSSNIHNLIDSKQSD